MHKKRVMLALRYVQSLFLVYCNVFLSLSVSYTNLTPQSAYLNQDHFQYLKFRFINQIRLSYSTFNFDAVHTPIA